MQNYSVKKARRVLGKDARGVSDDELKKDIEIATLLKDLFFDNYRRKKKA